MTLKAGTAPAEEGAGPASVSGRAWTERLSEPFDQKFVMFKPVLSCGGCREAPSKSCAEHTKRKCGDCGLTISPAHIHLSYVGHADVTGRLNEVDPRWNWEPAYKEVPNDVMIAAIATGNPEIVSAVIGNAPPLFDRHGGMWMNLTIHDDEGQPVTRLAYGDSERKVGPNAVKEVIGDGIRNGGMRFGVARDLWSKADLDENKALSDNDPGTAGQAPKRRRASVKTAPDGEEATAKPAKTKEQALANLCRQIVEEGSGVGILEEVVYKVAQRTAGLLGRKVSDPWTKEPSQLTKVIGKAKDMILAATAGHAETGGMTVRNVSMEVEGNILTIRVKLDERGHDSASGKSVVIATTEGAADVPETDLRMNINVYRRLRR